MNGQYLSGNLTDHRIRSKNALSREHRVSAQGEAEGLHEDYDNRLLAIPAASTSGKAYEDCRVGC